MTKRKPAEPEVEIIPPQPSEDDHPLRWFDMAHYKKPPEPMRPLPHPVIAHLARTLEDAMTLAKSGGLSPLIAAQMLKTLSPIVKRQEHFRAQHADDPHFTAEDQKLANKIANLLTFGKATEYSRTEISAYLHHHRTRVEITTALSLLHITCRAVVRTAPNVAGYPKPREVCRLSHHGDYPFPVGRPPQVVPRPTPAAVSPAPTVARTKDGRPIWGEPDNPLVIEALKRAEARQQRPQACPQKPVARVTQPPVWR